MGKFIIHKGTDDHYYFRLIAGNGDLIFTSERYLFKTNCKKGIDVIRSNAASFLNYELGKSLDGKYYFKLMGSKNNVIVNSIMYDSPAKRNNCIEVVKNTTPHAPVIDQTRVSEISAA